MAPMVLNLPKDDPHERTEEWSQVHILSNLYDFANEQSALEKKYIDRGDIPLFCAKGHPELAGKGVEFCWGVSKRNFRKINDSVGKNLHANVLKSFKVLDLATTCRCSRRTRRYRAGYASGAGTKSYEEVEKFVAHHKCHRNIFDQEKKWIKQMGNLTHSRGTHQWSTSFARGRQSAQIYYPRTEGIDCHDGRLFFVSKERKEQFVLDLDDETFTTTTTVSGMFDQIAYTRNGIVDKGDGKGKGRRILSKGSKGQPMLFFLEESGGRNGIHARDRLGNYHTILEGQDANWVETTGLAFSPDRRHMYFAFQQEGLLYDVWREDGGRFDAEIHRADYDS